MNSVQTFFNYVAGTTFLYGMLFYRQPIKGTFHSTCPAHATEATGSRQSSEEYFVFSPLVPLIITHYYTFYEGHILHWLRHNQRFILCYIESVR